MKCFFFHGVLLSAVSTACRANSRLPQIILKDKNAEIQPQAVPLFEEGPFACERWRVLERRRRSRTKGATNKANGKTLKFGCLRHKF